MCRLFACAYDTGAVSDTRSRMSTLLPFSLIVNSKTFPMRFLQLPVQSYLGVTRSVAPSLHETIPVRLLL